MTPIEKNIRVVDEAGKEYEPTWPKRAEGLVKHGRARFIDDEKSVLCLSRPPISEPEDKKMSEERINNAAENVTENAPENAGRTITEADVLVLLGELTELMHTLTLGQPEAPQYIEPGQDPEYYAAVTAAEECRNSSVGCICESVSALTKTANKLLDYLAKKGSCPSQEERDHYLEFVKDTVKESDVNVDFVGLWTIMAAR